MPEFVDDERVCKGGQTPISRLARTGKPGAELAKGAKDRKVAKQSQVRSGRSLFFNMRDIGEDGVHGLAIDMIIKSSLTSMTMSACRLLRIGAALAMFASPAITHAAGTIPHIDVLPLPDQRLEASFLRGLEEAGLRNGESISVKFWHAAISDQALKALPAQLGKSPGDVIVSAGMQLTRVAMQTGSPVVFVAGDPVSSGFAQSLSKPGGNGTGISVLTTDLDNKRLELLKRLVPKAKRIVFLRNPASAYGGPSYLDRSAAQLGVEITRIPVRNADELEGALRQLTRARFDAVLISGDTMLLQSRARITRALHAAKLPCVLPWAQYQDGTVLATYSPSFDEAMRKAAGYVAAILKGAKPADMPIEQLAHYELAINLQIAPEYGVKVPEELVLSADKVIK